eukprot:jgi/Picre1/28845/NNA_004242.t1
MAKSVTVYVLGVLCGIALVSKKPRRGARPSAIDSRKTFKMVIVVNTTLKMGKGKIGAQCAHGACGALETASEAKVRAWKQQGQAKVCLQAPQVQMLELAQLARRMGLNHCLVADAGRTQIAPGSKTVLAVGPDDTDAIDALTGTLKLL